MAVKNIAAPLPDVTLLPGSTVEVDAGAGGTVTGLVIHGFQIQPPPGSKPTVRLPDVTLLPGSTVEVTRAQAAPSPGS